MKEDIAYSVLEVTRDILKYGAKENEYQNNLSQLGKIVALTVASEVSRDSFTSSFLVLCVDILVGSLSFQFESEHEKELYFRNLRGVILLVRNLSVPASAKIDLSKIFIGMEKLISGVDNKYPYFGSCLQAYLQVLANFFTKEGSSIDCKMSSLAEAVNVPTVRFIAEKEDLKAPLNILLYTVLKHREYGNLMLRDKNFFHFVDFIIFQGFEQSKDSSFSADLLPLLQTLITRESFCSWIEKHIEGEDLDKTLNLCQLVVTSKDDWDVEERSALIEWDFKLYNELATTSIRLLTSIETTDRQLDEVHSPLVRCLDIMSDLCKYDEIRHFLEEKNAISSLISLLRATHENTEIKTPKSKKKVEEVIGQSAPNLKKSFPLVKSLIIEIFSFLCCQSFLTQEAMRELHGLELILSNCVIDDDNPYIKEHSILCLKFVLDNNPKNQEFVASLEAKKVVDGKALSEAGYEITIDEGNVQLKNSNKLK